MEVLYQKKIHSQILEDPQCAGGEPIHLFCEQFCHHVRNSLVDGVSILYSSRPTRGCCFRRGTPRTSFLPTFFFFPAQVCPGKKTEKLLWVELATLEMFLAMDGLGVVRPGRPGLLLFSYKKKRVPTYLTFTFR